MIALSSKRKCKMFLTTLTLSSIIFYFIVDILRREIYYQLLWGRYGYKTNLTAWVNTLELDNIKAGEYRASSYFDDWKPSNKLLKTARKQRILLYTTLFDGLLMSEAEEKVSTHCPVCTIIRDRKSIGDADIIIFHAGGKNDLPPPHKMPNYRTPNQKWVVYLHESPVNSQRIPWKKYNGMFNWTMSFFTDADIYEPYGYFVKIPRMDDKQKSRRSLKETGVSIQDISNSLKKRQRSVLWIVSNCKSRYSPRNAYVEELQNHIQVDIYGHCTGHICKGSKCDKLRKLYKFYLAFENSVCEDYITEKYWRTLEDGLVPIVLGDVANYENIAIPKSYISVQQFKTPKQLAEYLIYLNKNDTAYMEYFQWKKYYAVKYPARVCLVCKALFDPEKQRTKVYDNIDKYFGVQRCKNPVSFLSKYGVRQSSAMTYFVLACYGAICVVILIVFRLMQKLCCSSFHLKARF